MPGATDGTFLWALKQIPIVTMGAGDREVPHQKDEWVDLDQLVETVKIYALTALHYLSQGKENEMSRRLLGIRDLSITFDTPEGMARAVEGVDLRARPGRVAWAWWGSRAAGRASPRSASWA